MAITTNGVAGISADASVTLSNKTLESPVINNATFTGAQAGLEIKFGNNIVLEGTTNDAFEMTLSGGDPTADRTVTLPDSTGTVALTNQKLSVFAATSSSELAGVISDETGSGALVFGTSPVISGLTLSDGSIVFEGATADAYETTLTVTDPTADRTITLPNATTTLVGTDTTDTLTNKTLTSPTVSGLYLSDQSIVVEGSAADPYETTLFFTDPTADRTVTVQDASGVLALTGGATNGYGSTPKTLQDALIEVLMSAY